MQYSIIYTLLGFLNGVLYLGFLHHLHRHHFQPLACPNLDRAHRICFLHLCHSPGLDLHSHPHISWLWQSWALYGFPHLSPLWLRYWIVTTRKCKNGDKPNSSLHLSCTALYCCVVSLYQLLFTWSWNMVRLSCTLNSLRLSPRSWNSFFLKLAFLSLLLRKRSLYTSRSFNLLCGVVGLIIVVSGRSTDSVSLARAVEVEGTSTSCFKVSLKI